MLCVLCEDMEGTIGAGGGVRGEVFVVVQSVRFLLVLRRSDGDDDTGNVAGLSDGEGGTYVVDGNDGVKYKICISISSSKRPILPDRKSTRLNSSHSGESRMPSSA